MREPRIYLAQSLQVESYITLDASAAHHVRMVLRLQPGNNVRLFNGDGSEYRGELVEVHKQHTKVFISAITAQCANTTLNLHLILGISKGERMDLAMQKAVELGVTRLSPLLAKRSVVQLKGERLERRHQHWQQIVIAACEQSGRCYLPKLDLAQPLETTLTNAEESLRLVLHHQGTATLGTIVPPTKGVALLVGPEGGLDTEEIDYANRCGFIPLRLGPRILRTETAPLATIAAIQCLWGDFR